MQKIIKAIKEDVSWLIRNIDLSKFYEKNILITGATGFIARYFVYTFMELNKEKTCGCHVYVLAKNSNKIERWFGEYTGNEYFHVVLGSVEEPKIIPEKMDWIFHAAGISNTKQFFTRPVAVSTPNVIGTYQLLNDFAKNSDMSGFIFFSSGAVYGDCESATHNIKEDEYFKVNPLEITSCYSESKKMGESLCYSFYRQYNTPSKIVRIGHTYGPGIDLNDGHVYSDFVANIINKENILIKGNPYTTRPFTYIRDTVWGILITAIKGENGEAYNVCNLDCIISIGELGEILVNDLFVERMLHVEYKNDLSTYRANGQEQITVDTSKLKKLGWNGQISIREGFLRTVKSME